MPLLKMGTHKGCPYTSYVCLKSCYRGSIWRRVSARGSDLLFDTKKQQDGRMLLFRVKKNGVVRRAEELQIPLMDCNINTSPIIQGNFKPRAIRYAVYIGFAQEGRLCLIHRYPGHIVDQLLLRILICLHTSTGISNGIGGFQLLLYRLLLSM